MIGHSQLFYFCGIVMVLAVVEAVIFWMLPLWERPGLFFSMAVVPAFRSRPEGQTILRRYRFLVVVLIAIACGLVGAGAVPKRWPLLILGVAWLAFGPLVAFLIAREATLPHSANLGPRRESNAPRAAHLPGGWLLQCGPLVIVATAAIYLWAHWKRIPEIFPVHWGLDGLANGWSVRTPIAVFGPLIMAAAMVIGLGLVTYGVLREARVVRVSSRRFDGRDFPHQVGYFLAGIEYFLAITLSYVALLPLIGKPNIALVLMTSLLVIVTAFVGTHRLNQACVRARDINDLPLPEGPFGGGTLDGHWKLGMFYVNADDPALLVEKRWGIGYTLNYAHGLAWVITLLVALVPLALALAALFRTG